jgi:hypothetical protein
MSRVRFEGQRICTGNCDTGKAQSSSGSHDGTQYFSFCPLATTSLVTGVSVSDDDDVATALTGCGDAGALPFPLPWPLPFAEPFALVAAAAEGGGDRVDTTCDGGGGGVGCGDITAGETCSEDAPSVVVAGVAGVVGFWIWPWSAVGTGNGGGISAPDDVACCCLFTTWLCDGGALAVGLGLREARPPRNPGGGIVVGGGVNDTGRR